MAAQKTKYGRLTGHIVQDSVEQAFVEEAYRSEEEWVLCLETAPLSHTILTICFAQAPQPVFPQRPAPAKQQPHSAMEGVFVCRAPACLLAAHLRCLARTKAVSWLQCDACV